MTLPSQNFSCPKPLDFDFENSSTQPVIWQWNELSSHVREVILEMANFSTKAIATIPQQEAKEIEPWIKCTLNLSMTCISQGWVELHFD